MSSPKYNLNSGQGYGKQKNPINLGNNFATHSSNKPSSGFSNKNSFLPQGQKTKFQSQDSQGSDISYESSIQSQDDINIGRIEFFKEQMSRFFINYPELINHDIIENQRFQEDNISTYMQETQTKGWQNQNNIKKKTNTTNSDNPCQTIQTKRENLNRNWSIIADQILNEAKQSTSFLEDLSRRIALYRSKVEQEDLIDLLLKQEKNIMKEIDLEMNQKKKEIKGCKNTQNLEGVENMYFSWRKKRQIQNRLNLDVKDDQVTIKKHLHHESKQQMKILKKSDSNIKNRSNHRSLHKTSPKKSIGKSEKHNISQSKQSKKGGAFFLTEGYDQKDIPLINQSIINNQNSPKKFVNKSSNKINSQRQSLVISKSQSFSKIGKNSPSNHMIDFIKQNQSQQSFWGLQKENKPNQSHSQGQTFWKHLVNFVPKTEAGRQLCELIRKTNSPNDELGIKKTIMTFLSRSKDMIQNQVVLKSSISQKIQKLYNDDSKQLLMFYPTRMSSTPNMNNHSQNNTTNLSKQGIQGPNTGSLNAKDEVIDSTGTNNKFSNFVKQPSAVDQNIKMFQQGEKFMMVLEDIVEGPLMKYWMNIQENKL